MQSPSLMKYRSDCEFEYLINIPSFVYDKSAAPSNEFGRFIYQKIADDYGLPVFMLDAAFEPKKILDLHYFDNDRNASQLIIYRFLEKGPASTGDITQAVNMSQPAVQVNLKKLYAEGIIIKTLNGWEIKPERLHILRFINELNQKKSVSLDNLLSAVDTEKRVETQKE